MTAPGCDRVLVIRGAHAHELALAEVVAALAREDVAAGTIALALHLPHRAVIRMLGAARRSGAVPRSRTEERARIEGRVLLLLRDAQGQRRYAYARLGLTAAEGDILNVLMSLDSPSHDTIVAALYPRGAQRPAGAEQVVKVLISKMRRKLSPLGVTIASLRGHGYALAPQAKATLAALLDPEFRHAA